MEDVSSLQKRIKELENELLLKETEIRQLQREIPGSSIKFNRLKLDNSQLIQPEPLQDEPFWTTQRVRDTFISFFQNKHQHTHWPSSPVVPKNDPTLLFINAGMNQFKPIFLGQIPPNHPMAKLKRAVNSQKCIRAGGKHNDLDDVGKDVYHHTFFEMLGNWSFGDYFKEEAIAMAWELLTKVYKIDPNRLYVTYFEGDSKQNLEPDLEAKNIWAKFINEDHILPGNSKDNFWEMGETGPCGPCSEVHYDKTPYAHPENDGNRVMRNAAHLVNKDDPDVIEIWNLVFMQFNRREDSSLEKLPSQSVDTGLGLERLVSVLQNKPSNYDSDLFKPIFSAISQSIPQTELEVQNLKQYTGKVGKDDSGFKDTAYRVLADHLRTLTVAITDGALPSSEGRGYVLRRIIRRAVRFSSEILRLPPGALSNVVPVVATSLSNAFPELSNSHAIAFVQDVISEEERVFERTLKKGIDFFEKQSEKLISQGNTIVPGDLVFKLYESMGFPSDLTQLMAEEKGLKVDTAGYNVCMKHHVEISKNKNKITDEFKVKPFEAKQTSELENLGIALTKQEEFVYVEKDVDAVILAIYDYASEKFVSKMSDPERNRMFGVVLDKSSMYYESGGQIGDQGVLKSANAAGNGDQENDSGSVFKILDVQNFKGYVVHVGQLVSQNSTVAIGDRVTCCVDYVVRGRTSKNHTGTHLLNWALRKVYQDSFGSQVPGNAGEWIKIDQAGSLVNDEYLRFDYSSPPTIKTSLDVNQLGEIENLVNRKILDNEVVDTLVVNIDKARKIKALRAVFGETYPENVRVVALGVKIAQVLEAPEDAKWFDFSIELCGGNHVPTSAKIQKLVVMKDEAKSKNVRRIICLTGDKALEALSQAESWFSKVESCKDEEINSFLEAVKVAEIPMSQRRDLVQILNEKKAKLFESEKKQFNDLVEMLSAQVEKDAATGKKIQLVVVERKDDSVSAAKLVKSISKKAKSIDASLIVVIRSKSSISLALSIQTPHEKDVNGVELLQRLNKVCEIKGGGKPNSIVAVTQETKCFDKILDVLNGYVRK